MTRIVTDEPGVVVVSRGMDARKYLAAARALGCEISEQSERQAHTVLRCPEVHQGRVMQLSSSRNDTPWVAFQWLRKVKAFRVAQSKQRAATPNAEAVVTAPEPVSDDILSEMREAAAEASEHRKVADRKRDQLAEAKRAVGLYASELENAELDQLSAEEEVERLHAELKKAVIREN